MNLYDPKFLRLQGNRNISNSILYVITLPESLVLFSHSRVSEPFLISLRMSIHMGRIWYIPAERFDVERDFSFSMDSGSLSKICPLLMLVRWDANFVVEVRRWRSWLRDGQVRLYERGKENRGGAGERPSLWF